jgi:predicted transglutaminase-like cysteine proteinase
MRYSRSIILVILLTLLIDDSAEARDRFLKDSKPLTPIADGSPTLAPFQHVRFCLRYPSDCKSDPSGQERIDLSEKMLELLNRVNRSVNTSIAPMSKSYGANLQEGWTIAPDMGDCNDYAVTKRHELLEGGLPSNALRLSVVKTTSGIGHLVLVVATTKGDIVLDNLSVVIRAWQNTDYQWMKIESASDARLWTEIKTPGIGIISQADSKFRLADRSAD